jgi:hypothetical protein
LHKRRQPKQVTARAQKSRGAAEVDVTSVSKMAESGKNWPAPPQKGGKKSRGAGGFTTVSNWTGDYIDVYAKINGTWYYGTMVSPWGQSSIYTGESCPYVYATNGSVYWGPSTVCADIWNLKP